MIRTAHSACHTVEELVMQLDGFTAGLPAHITEETADIDRRICERKRCPECGYRGMEYRPFHLKMRYRVLAVCSCGCAEEI